MNAPTNQLQAFPCINPGHDSNWDKRDIIQGMTLRDYFAGKALTGMLANVQLSKTTSPHVLAVFARDSYSLADAMLEARK